MTIPGMSKDEIYEVFRDLTNIAGFNSFSRKVTLVPFSPRVEVRFYDFYEVFSSFLG